MSKINGYDREIYELWYEYLKKNYDYRSFCEWIKDKKMLESRLKNLQLTTEELANLPDGLRNCNIDVLCKVFTFWGFVHDRSFETIMGDKSLQKRQLDRIENFRSTYTYDRIRHDVSNLFIKRYNRKPTEEEIPTFIKNIQSAEDMPIEDYLQQNIHRKKIKIYPKLSKEVINSAERRCLPQYLRVWELREEEERDWPEIIDIIFTEKSEDWRRNNGIRVVNRYYNKAKKLIKNAGKNNFPGKTE